MRILDTKQIRELDAYTIQHEPIASIHLMERASRAFVDWFTLRVDASKKIGVVCGTGNNGGDGLAIARMLHEWQYAVKVWIVSAGIGESTDFKVNEKRLPPKVEKEFIKSETDAVSFDDCAVLIDAIFGSGLSRPAAGVYGYVINRYNETEALRIAVDIPSGLMADSPSSGAIAKAHYTISFQLPKLAFLLPESHVFTGEWQLLDIGLDKKFIRESDTRYFFTRLKDVRKLLRPRSKNDHKGTYGHALLVAGSYGKMGAAILASRGALRAGLGLLSVHVPGCGYDILQTAVPEAMVEVDEDEKVLSALPKLDGYETIGIGPGLGQDARTVKALARLFENFQKPMVIDADAINIIAANRHLMSVIPPGSVLTPHPKEFERLTGPWKNDFERLEIQRQLAVSLKAVVVLKGAHTSVATEKGLVYFNSTGNPGMATGGTGDVLTGVITGLLAQKYRSDEAAIAGVLLHGLAGDLAVREGGIDALIASDLITHLPGAFLKVVRKRIF
jgi:hydroxyethylthiazole kinase-like uncharacterized protein yjeF